MPAKDPMDRRLISEIAAHESWAHTDDRPARTASARAAFDKKFLDQAGGDPVKARHLRSAYYARLSLTSVQSRRKASNKPTSPEAEAHA